jgi:PEGA domain
MVSLIVWRQIFLAAAALRRIVESKSLIAVIALGAGVLCLFAYLYLREWRLRVSFKRYRFQEPSERAPAMSLAQGAVRKPLAFEEPRPAAGKQAEPSRWESLWGKAGGRGRLVIGAAEYVDIFINGRFFGNPPAKINLPEGLHLVEIKRVGYKDYSRQIRVIDGAELTIRPRLEKRECFQALSHTTS